MMAMQRNSRRLQDLRATQASARKPRWAWDRYGPMRWKQQWRGTLHGRFRERLRCECVEHSPSQSFPGRSSPTKTKFTPKMCGIIALENEPLAIRVLHRLSRPFLLWRGCCKGAFREQAIATWNCSSTYGVGRSVVLQRGFSRAGDCHTAEHPFCWDMSWVLQRGFSRAGDCSISTACFALIERVLQRGFSRAGDCSISTACFALIERVLQRGFSRAGD